MQRWFLAGCSAFLFTVLVSTGRGDDAAPAKASSPFARLISLLSDPDPAVRLDSRERLINQGEAARADLRKALATADPQTRCEIDHILLHIRWTGFGDSDNVEHAFLNYSEEDAETRCGQIDVWLAPPQSGGGTALLRIIVADPSPAVRWEAASSLSPLLLEGDPLSRQVFDYASGISLPRDAYLPPEQNAPLLAAAGWSIRFSKPDKAAELIKKALAIEAEHPSAFRGQTDFAFDWLIQRAFAQKDFKQMVQLLREQAERAPWSTGELPDPVAQLFAAHADHGPLPGLAGDLRSYQEYLGHPELIYTLARMLERRDHRIGAAMVNALAMIMGGPTGESHYMTGVFLAERGWSAAAERELLCSLTLSNGRLYESYVELSALAEQRDDDLSAAQYLERGLQQLRDSGQIRQSLLAEQIESQIQLHYVRAFRQAHDLNALKTHLEKFMQFNQTAQMLDRDPEQAADIVPALQDVGRNAEADEIFDAAYAAIRGKVNTAPTDPMPKNNLAWLCACSGKKLDEAVKYSNEAVALDPEDAACLDTQAEAFMRTGNAQRAVEIETHALQIKPEDVYMKKQLERFRAAAAKK